MHTHKPISRVLLAMIAICAVQGSSTARAENLSIVLTGQALLQSDIRTQWPNVVPNMRPLLKGDVVFTNFETMIIEPGASLTALTPNDMGHYGPPQMLDVLTDMGFNLVAMANNHAYDLLEQGVANNIREAKARRLTIAGTGMNLAEATAPAYLTTPHGKVALIAMATGAIRESGGATETKPGVNELPLEGEVPGVDAGHPREQDALRILRSIGEAKKKADIVIAYHHNHAYDKNFAEVVGNRLPDRLVPPNWIKLWAHRQVDAGADLVVLQGLPEVQGLEIYKGHPIFYDMGNFIFQLVLSFQKLFTDPFVYQSVVAHVEFDKKHLKSITFHPITLTDEASPAGRTLAGVPSPATGAIAQTILQRVAELSRAFGTEISVKGDLATVNLSHAHSPAQ